MKIFMLYLIDPDEGGRAFSKKIAIDMIIFLSHSINKKPKNSSLNLNHTGMLMARLFYGTISIALIICFPSSARGANVPDLTLTSSTVILCDRWASVSDSRTSNIPTQRGVIFLGTELENQGNRGSSSFTAQHQIGVLRRTQSFDNANFSGSIAPRDQLSAVKNKLSRANDLLQLSNRTERTTRQNAEQDRNAQEARNFDQMLIQHTENRHHQEAYRQGQEVYRKQQQAYTIGQAHQAKEQADVAQQVKEKEYRQSLKTEQKKNVRQAQHRNRTIFQLSQVLGDEQARSEQQLLQVQTQNTIISQLHQELGNERARSEQQFLQIQEQNRRIFLLVRGLQQIRGEHQQHIQLLRRQNAQSLHQYNQIVGLFQQANEEHMVNLQQVNEEHVGD